MFGDWKPCSTFYIFWSWISKCTSSLFDNTEHDTSDANTKPPHHHCWTIMGVFCVKILSTGPYELDIWWCDDMATMIYTLRPRQGTLDMQDNCKLISKSTSLYLTPSGVCQQLHCKLDVGNMFCAGTRDRSSFDCPLCCAGTGDRSSSVNNALLLVLGLLFAAYPSIHDRKYSQQIVRLSWLI